MLFGTIDETDRKYRELGWFSKDDSVAKPRWGASGKPEVYQMDLPARPLARRLVAAFRVQGCAHVTLTPTWRGNIMEDDFLYDFLRENLGAARTEPTRPVMTFRNYEFSVLYTFLWIMIDFHWDATIFLPGDENGVEYMELHHHDEVRCSPGRRTCLQFFDILENEGPYREMGHL